MLDRRLGLRLLLLLLGSLRAAWMQMKCIFGVSLAKLTQVVSLWWWALASELPFQLLLEGQRFLLFFFLFLSFRLVSTSLLSSFLVCNRDRLGLRIRREKDGTFRKKKKRMQEGRIGDVHPPLSFNRLLLIRGKAVAFFILAEIRRSSILFVCRSVRVQTGIRNTTIRINSQACLCHDGR